MDTDRKTSATSPVVARVTEAYSLNVKLNIVGGRDIPGIVRLRGCQPRQGAPRRTTETVDLPEETRNRLAEISTQLVKWLAADQANAHAYIADPMAALAQAGVKLERSDLKQIARVRSEVSTLEVVRPGLTIESMTARVSPKGKVRKVETADEECNCNDNRKGGR